MLLSFAILATASPSVGVTWDEPIYHSAAENAAHWFGLLAQGRFAEAAEPYNFGMGWGLVNEATPLVRIVNAAGWTLTRDLLPVPLSHRIGTIALASVSLGAVVWLVGRCRSLGEAIFAAAAILATPRLFYHAQLGATDFANAAMWTVATLIFYRQMSLDTSGGLPRMRAALRLIHRAFVVGAWAAIALLAKINAILLFPFWGIWALLYRRSWFSLSKLALAPLFTLVITYAGWPWVWQDTLVKLERFVDEYRMHPAIGQWFAGDLYIDTPWYIPVTVLLVTTPALILFPAAYALWAVRRAEPAASPWVTLHLLGAAIIVGYFALPFNNLHDQDRMLAPAAIHIAILSAFGFVRLCEQWPKLRIVRRFAASDVPIFPNTVKVALAASALLPGIVAIVDLHPYQLAYYNEIVGGPRGAARLNMETIYFASTYSYFLPYLNDLPPESKVWVVPNSWGVLYYYRQHGLLRPDIVPMRPPGWGSFFDGQNVPFEVGWLDDADYVLVEHRQTTFNDKMRMPDTHWMEGKPVVATLERDGVVLAALYAR